MLQSSLASYEDITFTNAATGVMVEGSTRSFPETCQLQVDVNSDQVFFSSPDMEDAGIEETQKQTYYEAFGGLAEDGKCVVYTLTMTDAAGNDLSKGDVVDAAKIILPIPEEWKVTADQKLNVLAYSNFAGADLPQLMKTTTSADESIITVDLENQQVIIDPNMFDFNKASSTWQFLTRGDFVLYVEGASINPNNLGDGIYQVDARTTKTTDNSLPSMSNAAFNHTAYLVKNGQQQDLYLRFHSLTVNGMVAYIGGLHSIDADTAEEFGATYFDYYTEAEAGAGSSNSLLTNAVDAFIRSTQLAEDEVEIPVILKKAYDTSDSMGNASLNQNGILKVNADGSATVKLDFHSMSFSGFTGYLGYLKILNKDTVGRNDLGGWVYDDSDFMNDVLTVVDQPVM